MNTPNKHYGNPNFLDLLDHYIQLNPNSIALKFENESLSYSQLGIRSSIVANELKKSKVESGSIVGIAIDRSINMIVAIIGVLKAGCAYLPIDIDYPINRINYILNDSGIGDIIISDSVLKKHESISYNKKILNISRISWSRSSSEIRVDGNTKSNSLAYVIYTSASTGNPKGVMISHGNLAAFIGAMKAIVPFKEKEVLLMLAPISFDLSISETLLPLACGMTVVIANREQQRVPELFCNCILSHNVSVLHSTPSRLNAFLEYHNNEWLKGINTLLVGGEDLPQNLFNSLKNVYKGSFYNIYGPTEATVWSTIKDLTKAGVISIGKALPGYNIYIVDERGNLVIESEVGEIYIGGPGVAQGYLNNLELTHEKFVFNNFTQEGKLYRTGDLGVIDNNGDLQFRGRKDNQIKIRGFRVELMEVQKEVSKLSYFQEAVVAVNSTSSGDKVLCVFYTSEMDINVEDAKLALCRTLPEYMIPTIFQRVPTIPISFNGKVDLKALKDGLSYTVNKQRLDESDIRSKVKQIWEDASGRVLNDERQNFFQVGGHSLNSIVLITRLEKHYDIKIPIAQFLLEPTFNKLFETVVKLSEEIPEKTVKQIIKQEGL